MTDEIANLPKDQKAAWKRVTNLIYNAGFCEGRREGYEAGKATVSFSKRAMFQSGFFMLGCFVGAFFGMGLALILNQMIPIAG